MVISVIGVNTAFAEGSKELIANLGDRADLDASSNNFPTQGLVRVYVEAGETIYLGSENTHIVLISPTGRFYETDDNNIGRIRNATEESNGPAYIDVGTHNDGSELNDGTYYAYTRTATETGIWSVFFLGTNSYFDVSVSTSATATSSASFIKGRAYMNVFAGSMANSSFSEKFYGIFYVLTNDGYHYTVNANGLAGNGFVFFSNNKGYKKTDGSNNPSYLSEDSDSPTKLHDPRKPDDAATGDVTHKLFFNKPNVPVNAAVPIWLLNNFSDNIEDNETTVAGVVVASGGTASTTWLKTVPTPPEIKEFAFTGIEGTPDQAGTSPLSGAISFTSNQVGSYTITIDVPNTTNDVTLTGTAINGLNSKVWDGKDGAGNNVEGTISKSAIKVGLKAGEVHFPYIDVERNVNGIIIKRWDETWTTVQDDKVYWNDHEVADVDNDGDVQNDDLSDLASDNQTPSSPITQLNGVSSATNGHKWGKDGNFQGDFGNNKGLDTWTYLLSNVLSPSVDIQLKKADLEVLPMDKAETGLCIGDQQTYTVAVRNNGPHGVKGAKFQSLFSSELIGVTVTPDLTLGTASVVSSSITGNQYDAVLNMDNGAVLTFTIKGTVSKKPVSGNIQIDASIMRPADVTDPNATNPDAAPPANAAAECIAGCNNLKSDLTPVLVSNISIAPSSKAEGSGGSNNMAFVVSATPENTKCDVTVKYEITHGTINGTTNTDFVGVIKGTVTIPKGEPSVDLLIPIVTDQIIEADENFTITISEPTSGGVITTGTAIGTIEDDDNIPDNKILVIESVNGSEGVSSATFRIRFPTGITADKPTEIQYELSGVAKGEGIDYDGTKIGTIIIPALSNSFTITLPVIDDAILEGDETIIVTTGTITSVYTGISVSNSPYTFYINDDDNALLLSGPGTVYEGNDGITKVKFRVSLDIIVGSSFTIDYETIDGTATISDGDYVAKSGTLTFLPDKLGQYFDIEVEVNGDYKIEGNESILVELDPLSLSNDFGGLLKISGSPVTLSIIDDDNIPENKTITITKVDGTEDGAPAQFIFSFPPDVSTDAATTIQYSLSGVALGNGTDYTGLASGTVTIPANSNNSPPISLTIVDDLIIEDSESVTITTGTVSNPKYSGIGVANSPFSLNIIDNDNTPVNNTITLKPGPGGSEPSGIGHFTVSYPANIVRSTPTTVTYTISGDAVNGGDYKALTGTVQIPAYANSAPINIEVIDDQIIEAAETVTLTLVSATSGSASLNISPGAESITITDNDNTAANNTISLTKKDDAEEGLTDGKFQVSLPFGYVSSIPITVNYVIGGTATNGVDYTNLTGQATIQPGSNFADIDIDVNDDLIIESTETVILGLQSATSSIFTPMPVSSSTEVADLRDNDNIADNNIITLTRVSNGKELGNNVQFLVSYPAGVTNAAITRVHYTISGTALNGTDYDFQGTYVDILPNTNSYTINVPVKDDLFIENTETIILKLTTVENTISVPQINVAPATEVSADIEDNDNTAANNKIILTAVSGGSEPGTPGRFTIGYPNGVSSSEPTTVTYSVGGSAILGTDYTILNATTVTILPGFSSIDIDVTVKDDKIIEGDETVSLTLISASNNGLSTLETLPATAESIVIQDDDNTPANNIITLEKIDDGKEPGPYAKFRVRFPFGYSSTDETVVKYTVAGTAIPEIDYKALTGIVKIPAGSEYADIDIEVKDDLIIEATETVILTITEATHSVANLSISPATPVSADIEDNDNTAANNKITLTPVHGEEGGAKAKFIFSFPLGYTSSAATQVTYSISGTAVAGTDYTALSGATEIPAGENSVTIEVDINDDSIIEATETIDLKLETATNAVITSLALVPANPVSANIIDNDNISANNTITLTKVANAQEPSTPGQFLVSFPPGVTSSVDTEVTYTIGGIALNGTDYTLLSSTKVTIPAYANSATVDVTVVDDKIIEPKETVTLTLNGASNAISTLTYSSGSETVDIIDDDNIPANTKLTLTRLDHGGEPGDDVHYVLAFPPGITSAEPTIVTYSVGGSALTGTDYTIDNTSTITIPYGVNSVPIDVTVSDDLIVEPTETVTIDLILATSSIIPSITLDPIPPVSADIADNDNIPANKIITIDKVDGVEGIKNASFTFSLPPGISFSSPTTIKYTLSGSATSGGSDYSVSPLEGSVNILPGENSATVSLIVLDDDVIEDIETAIITTTSIENSDITGIVIANSPQTLYIEDNDDDRTTLTLSVSDAFITEESGGTPPMMNFKVTLDKATNKSFEVKYTTVDGTATIAGNDYVETQNTLKFSGLPGESQTVSVPVTPDLMIEKDETFSFRLYDFVDEAGGTDAFGGRLTIQGSPTLATIRDDDLTADNAKLTIVPSKGSETGPIPGSFIFKFPDGVTADAPTTVYFGFTGTTLSADYTASSALSITIPAETNSWPVTLTVNDDDIVEGPETVILTTGTVNSPYGIKVDNSPQSLIIEDNDQATLSITGGSVMETHSGTTVRSFTVTLDKPTNPFTVDYKTIDGTAKSPEDYDASTGTLTFINTTDPQTFNITITGDRKIEADETFTVELSNLSTHFENALKIQTATATGIIRNDDDPEIRITSSDGLEAGPVDGSFTFSFPEGVTMDAPTEIHYSLTGTATSGEDYNSPISGIVTIPANTTSVSLPIPVLADLKAEATETVILTTGSVTSPYAATVINPTHPLNIFDKNQAVLSLTGDPIITEGDDGTVTATYTVTLNQATEGSFSIDYIISDGTATAGDDDYENSSNRLNFSGKAESKIFTVTINGDKKIEKDETFSVSLGNLIASFPNKPVVQTTPVVTIIKNDDDDQGIITIVKSNGSETGPVPGTFTFKFPDGASSDAPTIINYGVGGSAFSSGTNYDYTATPALGSVTIPANTNSFTLNLDVNDDDITEGTETVELTTAAITSPYIITVANSPQTLDIEDNDNATLSITGDSKDEGDSGTTSLTFTITLSKATNPFTIDYKTVDGTAKLAENDYSASSGTIEFDGTPGPKTVTIAVTGDQKIEADETITLELSNLSDHFKNTLTITNSSAIGEIKNDDEGKINITYSNGSENGPVAGRFTFSFDSGVKMDAPTVINYTLSGTADTEKDYTPVSGSVTIPEGASSIDLDIFVKDDEVIEENETVILTVNNISSPYPVTVNNSPQSLTIQDNDKATVTLTGRTTIDENDGTQLVTYTATLDKATSGSFKVDYAASNGTATTADNDYEILGNGVLEFAGLEGETKTFTVRINNDNKIEADETFSVSLSNLITSLTNRPLIQAAPVVTTIVNDDLGIIEIVPANGSETGPIPGTFTFRFKDGKISDAPTVINYGVGGTALSSGTNYDYTANPAIGSITIPAETNSFPVTLTVNDDDIVEGPETVILTTGTVSSPYGITVENTSQSLKIEDNDQATLSITGGSELETHSGTRTITFTVTLDKPTNPFTVDYKTIDGTAKSPEDYGTSTGTLQFGGNAGVQTINIDIPVTGDRKIEADEIFTVELSNLSTHFENSLKIQTATATGTIENDDLPEITITSSDGLEAGPVDGKFTFSFPEGVTMDAPTVIHYSLTGTATSGEDYNSPISGIITIPANTTSVSLPIPVLADLMAEDIETVILTTGSVTSPYAATVINSPYPLNIIDKNQAVLSLTGDPIKIEGDDGTITATYTVTLNQATEGSFSIDYIISDGTATAGDDDYENSSNQLHFSGEATSKNFTVTINGDKKIEKDETFSVSLNNLIASFPNKPLVQTTPVVTTIKNDDEGEIEIIAANGSETGPVPGTFTFRFKDDKKSDAPTIIHYGVGGSASSSGTDKDYTTTPALGSVTIPANTSSFTLNLDVNDDQIVEGIETVELTTAAVSSPYIITVANSPKTLDIEDNDNAALSITSTPVFEGNSGTAGLTFTVTLNKATGPFTVNYKTKDGTATLADNDYSALTGTIKFDGNAGESRPVTIAITGDKRIEANETITLELSDLSNNYNNTLVLASPATGTILDDDNTVNNKRITITTVNGAEGGVNASIKFSFPDGVSTDGITSIPYTLAGTASGNGIDYDVPSTGTLTIAPGETFVLLPLLIKDDTLIEGTESVIANAGIISNDKYTGLSLANAPQTLTIADNDVATVSIIGPVTITETDEGSLEAVFKVKLDKEVGSGFTVSYRTEDGTALGSDNDYIPVSNGTVPFVGAAGEEQEIKITIIGDKRIERDEEYRVRLTGLSSDFGGGLTFGNTTATGIILDNDNKVINRQITITKSDGTEGAADGSFTFSFPEGITLDAPTTINYTLSGIAKGSGDDYTNSQVGSVTIPAGRNYYELPIDVVDDSDLEPSETVIITTGAITNSNYNDIKVANSPFILNIEDNDNASLSITTMPVIEGNSGTKDAVFRVTLNNSTGAPFTVNYATSDGSATVADKDYIASSGPLTFSGEAGDFVEIKVPVKGDLKIEKNEEFLIKLTDLSNDFDHRLIINNSPAIGVIQDDDNNPTNRRITISEINGAEGGNDARFKFSFPAGVSTDDWTTINYVLSGTALGDVVDYSAASNGSVIIAPGETSVFLDLSVIDDAIIESTETVTVSTPVIENNSYSGLIASNSPVSLNITDNDKGELKLSGPVVVQEGNSGPEIVKFTVTLTAGTGSPFSIDYTTMDGTAKVSDNDYAAKSGRLEFDGLESEVDSIFVLVNGDKKIESDEEFNLMLRNLSNNFGYKLTFSGAPVKGRILNDDNGTITITKEDGKEGNGLGSFTFNLSPGVYSDKPIIIPYNLSGTALGNNLDYQRNTSGSITLLPGQSKTTLNLVVNDDSVLELDETVKITTGIVLSSMPNAVLVENSPQELIIEDNDSTPIIITNPVIKKEENSGYVTAEFDATLPLATSQGFSFEYATSDGTATVADNDYVATSGKLTFAGKAGEVHKISVSIKGDVKVEEDEKFNVDLTKLSNDFGGRLTLEFPTVSGVIHDDDMVPMALDDVAVTPEDTPVTFSLIANDTDIEGIDPTGITIKTPPAKGEVKVNRDGTVTYTPELNDVDTYTFTYTVKDLTGLESNEANVTVTITPVNDPPVAEDDSLYVQREGTLRANVSLNDTDLDGDRLQFKVTVPPTKGTLVSFNETDGSFIYTPTSSTYTGFDQFTYQAIDATGLTDEAIVTIGIQPKAKAKLTPTLVTLKEGEAVVVTAVLSEPLLQDVTLMLEYNGDAELDKDYKLSGDILSFTIKAGDTTTTQQLTLSTVRDYLKEAEEVAEINIVSATPTEFVEIESGSEITITELTPEDRPVGPDENADINPDPYASPDGDGLGNESFVIHNIDKYPDNEVVIFNRWGNEVFRIKEYNNKDKAFVGVANKGLLANSNSTLPDGVYYFIIYTKVDNVTKMNKGYVIIKR